MKIWKKINNFPDYEINNFGEVKRSKSGLILKPDVDKDGYFRVDLYKNGKPKHKYVHVLVCETFNNYELKSGECTHHKDNNKKNNDFNNLQIVTKFEHNSLHKSGKNNYWFGRHRSEKTKESIRKKNSGENGPKSILKEQDVIEIWKLLDEGILKQKEIGNLFGVDQTTISNVKTGKHWKMLGRNNSG